MEKIKPFIYWMVGMYCIVIAFVTIYCLFFFFFGESRWPLIVVIGLSLISLIFLLFMLSRFMKEITYFIDKDSKNKTIDSIQKDINSIKSDTSSIKKNINDIIANIDSLQKAIDTIDHRIS